MKSSKHGNKAWIGIGDYVSFVRCLFWYSRAWQLFSPMCDRGTQTVSEAQWLQHYRSLGLLRASGTEPLIRVMTEGENASEIIRIAEELALVVENSRA